jgi:tripartite-type tricarboxylate transporter receptor subunit TctC
MSFASIPATLPHVKAGRLRALALGSAKRSPLFPNLPTVAESGLPGFDISAWNGMLAPRTTAPRIVSRVSTELKRISQNEEVKERAAVQGADLIWQTPEEFRAYMVAEMEKWGKVVRAAGVKAD